MQIKGISKSSFRSLYHSVGLDNIISSGNNSSEFKKELSVAKNIIRQNGLHRKRNVDLILNYNESDGFYTVISSKRHGVPINPNYRHPIRIENEFIQSLTNWVDGWNYAYSSEAQKEQKQLIRNIRKVKKLFK